jgi:hypothetical protein
MLAGTDARSICHLRSATGVSSATCTSTSDSASPAQALSQLEAQVEFYELSIQPPVQTTGSGKDLKNGRFENTVYARYRAYIS